MDNKHAPKLEFTILPVKGYPFEIGCHYLIKEKRGFTVIPFTEYSSWEDNPCVEGVIGKISDENAKKHKWFDVIEGYNCGEEVEVKRSQTGWYCLGDPAFWTNTEHSYRIKPKEEGFNSQREFLQYLVSGGKIKREDVDEGVVTIGYNQYDQLERTSQTATFTISIDQLGSFNNYTKVGEDVLTKVKIEQAVSDQIKRSGRRLP